VFAYSSRAAPQRPAPVVVLRVVVHRAVVSDLPAITIDRTDDRRRTAEVERRDV
jgi:hypothetical protein